MLVIMILRAAILGCVQSYSLHHTLFLTCVYNFQTHVATDQYVIVSKSHAAIILAISGERTAQL